MWTIHIRLCACLCNLVDAEERNFRPDPAGAKTGSGREFFTAMRAAAGQNLAATGRGHARAEAVAALADELARLKGALHRGLNRAAAASRSGVSWASAACWSLARRVASAKLQGPPGGRLAARLAAYREALQPSQRGSGLAARVATFDVRRRGAHDSCVLTSGWAGFNARSG